MFGNASYPTIFKQKKNIKNIKNISHGEYEKLAYILKQYQASQDTILTSIFKTSQHKTSVYNF